MYKPLYKKNGSLKHSAECKMVFGKKDKDCHRCVELINGAEPRLNWRRQDMINYKTKNCCGSYLDFGVCTCGT